jgi:hypothetical protein
LESVCVRRAPTNALRPYSRQTGALHPTYRPPLISPVEGTSFGSQPQEEGARTGVTLSTKWQATPHAQRPPRPHAGGHTSFRVVMRNDCVRIRTDRAHTDSAIRWVFRTSERAHGRWHRPTRHRSPPLCGTRPRPFQLHSHLHIDQRMSGGHCRSAVLEVVESRRAGRGRCRRARSRRAHRRRCGTLQCERWACTSASHIR